MTGANPILGLGDLESWSFRGTALAVLGHPVWHSLSPQMHNAALAELAKDDRRFADWRYFKVDVPVEDLPRALDLLHRGGFHGLNLTVPHKVAALGRIAAVDERARPAGAVNTLLREAGGWRGFNTDGYGLAEGVRESLGIELAGAKVLLLGAGGAARAVAAECLGRKCAGLWIWNRTKENALALVERMRAIAEDVRTVEEASPPLPSWLRGKASPPDLLINATSLGLNPSDLSPIDLSALSKPVGGVYDLIYNPTRTALLRQAEQLGVRCANGLSMLVHQGAKALEIWSGVPTARIAPVMRAAVKSGLLP